MAQDEIEKALQEAEETLKRIEAKTEKMRYDSQRDVLKHFDRIHDHLFFAKHCLHHRLYSIVTDWNTFQ